MNDAFSTVSIDGRVYDLDGRFVHRHKREPSRRAKLCSFDKGGPSETTTTQKFEPPAVTQPGWEGYVTEGQRLAQQPFQNYNMPRVAPVNSLQLAGLNIAADRGLNGDPLGNSARGLATSTINGDYLHSNPHLDQMIDDTTHNMADAAAVGGFASNAALQNFQGAFGGSSYTNGVAQQQAALAKAVAQMGTQARSQNYDFERGNQMSAMGMAPQFAQMDWNDIRGLTGAGDAMNAHTQSLLDSGKAQMDEQIAYPWKQLENFGSVLSRASGTYGGGGTSSGSVNGGGGNLLSSLAGVGTIGYGLKAGGFI